MSVSPSSDKEETETYLLGFVQSTASWQRHLAHSLALQIREPMGVNRIGLRGLLP